MALGFLGGTGIEAEGLALRFAAAGAPVILGSRSADRAGEAAAACNAVLGAPLVRGLDNAAMVEASEIVFITVPFEKAVDAVGGIRSLFRPGHVLVDVTVPLVFREGRAEHVEQAGESNSETIARHLPDFVPLVAAFKTIPASALVDLRTVLDCDVFLCGDSHDAKEAVMKTAALIPSLRALDAGPLRTARTLERMAVLAVDLNRRYRKKGARFRIQGV